MSDWTSDDIKKHLCDPLLEIAADLRKLGKQIDLARARGEIPFPYVPLNDRQMLRGLVQLAAFKKELERKLEDLPQGRRLYRRDEPEPPEIPPGWPPSS